MLAGIDLLYEQVEISQTDAAVITTDLTTYTFSGMELGAAHSNRKIVVHVVMSDGSAGTTISTLTIGGISAAVVSDGVTNASADGAGASTSLSAQWMAAVPTGTTGDIVVTFSAESNNCAITVYRLINAATTAFHVATDITADGSNAVSASLNIPGFGVAIGSVRWQGNGATRTTTWDGLTENVDETIEATSTYSSASKYFATGQSGLTITATASGTLDLEALVLASFRPL